MYENKVKLEVESLGAQKSAPNQGRGRFCLELAFKNSGRPISHRSTSVRDRELRRGWKLQDGSKLTEKQKDFETQRDARILAEIRTGTEEPVVETQLTESLLMDGDETDLLIYSICRRRGRGGGRGGEGEGGGIGDEQDVG